MAFICTILEMDNYKKYSDLILVSASGGFFPCTPPCTSHTFPSYKLKWPGGRGGTCRGGGGAVGVRWG